MNENLQENVQQPQQPKNNDGKRLFYVILVVLSWLLFVIGLLFASSKCAKATDYLDIKYSNINASTSVDNPIWYNRYDSSYYANQNKITYDSNTDRYSITSITFTGLTPNSNFIWSLGNDTYYSYGTSQYKLVSANEWQPVSWSNLTSFNGNNVFVYNNVAYYFNGGTARYSLTSGTTWNLIDGLSCTNCPYSNLSYVWFDGVDYYYSNNATQLKMGSTPLTWQVITFSGVSSFRGSNVATLNDGTILYNNSGTLYKLNGTTWELENGIYSDFFNGNNISIGLNHFILDNKDFISIGVYFEVIKKTISGGGYTQQDLDEAYADGQLNALNYISSTNYGTGTTYTSYTNFRAEQEMAGAYFDGACDMLNEVSGSTNGSGTTYTRSQINSTAQMPYWASNESSLIYSSGYTDGELYVQANPNSYNLYTQAQYNSNYQSGETAGYSEGALDMLNSASSSTYGTGTTYTSVPVGAIADEMSHAYSEGLNAGSYDNGYTDGQLNVLNYISQNASVVIIRGSAYGTGTHYSTYSTSNVDTELQNYTFMAQYNQSVDLIMYLSGYSELGGTGTQYVINDNTSWNQRYVYLMNEINSIISFNNGLGYDQGYQEASSQLASNISANPKAYGYVTLLQYNTDIDNTRDYWYGRGLQEGASDDISLGNTIISVASVPYVVLTSMFNFEVLGVNIFVLFTSLFTLIIAIWVIKKLWK